MKKNSYINIVLGGESIGSYGKIVNASIANENKKTKPLPMYLENCSVILLLFICLKEMIFLPS